jgi:CheY-like chemotaxis protein
MPAPQRLRGLVVDDNPDTAATLAKRIELMGHDARFLSHPESALLIAVEFQPHAVFYSMPI